MKLPTVLALALAGAYAGVLAITAPDMGYVRDEGYYFKAAEEYGRWWDVLFSKRFTEAFSSNEIQRNFSYNTEHPALVKLTQSVTFRVFHQWTGWASPGQSFRITGFLFAALGLLATYGLGRALFGPWTGLLGAALLASIPRYFYDAHLACFDVPMTAMWALGLWTFWRGFTATDLKPSIIAGLVFGLGLATKLNAFFLPVVYVLVWLRTLHFSNFGWRVGPSGGRDLALPPIPPALLACALLGPLVFLAHWPWLWHETFQRIGFYIGFHLNHEHYPIRYFGRVLVKPPFPIHFPWVMTFFTLPAPLFFLGALGLLRKTKQAWQDRHGPHLLLVVATVLPILMISLPSTPIFGGVKHWYNAMPTWCLLAAETVALTVAYLAERWPKPQVLAFAATLLVLAPGLLGIRSSHPDGIGFYNELAGGYRGGAALGMQRSFWGRPQSPADVAGSAAAAGHPHLLRSHELGRDADVPARRRAAQPALLRQRGQAGRCRYGFRRP